MNGLESGHGWPSLYDVATCCSGQGLPGVVGRLCGGLTDSNIATRAEAAMY